MTREEQKIAIAEWIGWKWYRYEVGRQGSKGVHWLGYWRVQILREKPLCGIRVRNVTRLKKRPAEHDPVELPSFFDILDLEEVLRSMHLCL